MQRLTIIILAAGLVVLCLTCSPAPSQETATSTSAIFIPAQAAKGDPYVGLNTERTTDGGWLWELLMDRLTIPLGPADQNTWPFALHGREQWIATTENGLVIEGLPAIRATGVRNSGSTSYPRWSESVAKSSLPHSLGMLKLDVRKAEDQCDKPE